MMGMLIRGSVAGAAGTTLLNTVSYGDMALRGRPSSSAPERTVDAIAGKAGLDVPGAGQTRESRLTGLGGLSGIAVGVGAGAAMAAVRKVAPGLPWWAGGLLTGALAMAATDVSMAELDVSDPRTWSAADWLSDAVPHLVYGLVTYGVLIATEPRS